MAFFDYNKKRNLALGTIFLAGLYLINLFNINQMLTPLMEYNIVGEIQISTIIGIATIAVAYLIYKRLLG